MDPQNLEKWQHQHSSHNQNSHAERNTWRVMWLTLVMMVVEIAAGWISGSMALLADGWHMGTHFFALGITAFAYWFSRRHAENPHFSFGTGKVDVLGGYTSAIVLAGVALLMIVESIGRLLSPRSIMFDEALVVAVIGLVVNLVSAMMLDDHAHGHDDDLDHHHHQHHHDHNLQAAYLHVLADALTSVLAIIALLAGKYKGWIWLDPVMGIVGALVITRWAWGLLRETSQILLDYCRRSEMTDRIHSLIEDDGKTRIVDLHLWRISSSKWSVLVSVVTDESITPADLKTILGSVGDFTHVSVEVNPCG